MQLQPFARRGVVQIKGHMPPPLFKFIASLPGFKKWDGADGVLFEASRKHLDLWREAFPDVTIEDKDGTLHKLEISVAPIAPYTRKLAPNGLSFAHQDRALSVAMARDYYGFWYDMGTGKSRIICEIAAEQFASDQIDRALVFTKTRGIPQFIDEQTPEHMPKGIGYRIARIPSTQAKSLFKYPNGNLLIAVAGYGALQSAAQTKTLLEFCQGGRTAIFLDESQEIKGWDTARVENLWKLRPHALKRYELSGEPEPKGPEDLYSQFMFLDPNILGHASLISFKNQFCVFGGYKTKEIVDYKNKEELAQLIAPHCEYLAITDCRDMPPRAWHDAIFEPSAEQRALYKKMKDELVVTVERALATPDKALLTRLCKNAASKFIALQQIANGWLLANPEEDGEKGELHVISDERALFVAETLLCPHGKTVVFARYHADLDSLCRAFAANGVEALEFSGRLSDAQNEANKLAFQRDSHTQVFAATWASGSTTLNLQCARRIVAFSNTFNYGDRAQGERRIWRTGQEFKCDYYDVFGFPVDRIVRANNVKKQDLSAQLKQITALAKLAEEL